MFVPWNVLLGDKDEPSKKVRVGQYYPVEPHPDGKHVILSITEYRQIEQAINQLTKLRDRVVALEARLQKE